VRLPFAFVVRSLVDLPFLLRFPLLDVQLRSFVLRSSSLLRFRCCSFVRFVPRSSTVAFRFTVPLLRMILFCHVGLFACLVVTLPFVPFFVAVAFPHVWIYRFAFCVYHRLLPQSFTTLVDSVRWFFVGLLDAFVRSFVRCCVLGSFVWLFRVSGSLLVLPFPQFVRSSVFLRSRWVGFVVLVSLPFVRYVVVCSVVYAFSLPVTFWFSLRFCVLVRWFRFGVLVVRSFVLRSDVRSFSFTVWFVFGFLRFRWLLRLPFVVYVLFVLAFSLFVVPLFYPLRSVTFPLDMPL